MRLYISHDMIPVEQVGDVGQVLVEVRCHQKVVVEQSPAPAEDYAEETRYN